MLQKRERAVQWGTRAFLLNDQLTADLVAKERQQYPIDLAQLEEELDISSIHLHVEWLI